MSSELTELLLHVQPALDADQIRAIRQGVLDLIARDGESEGPSQPPVRLVRHTG